MGNREISLSVRVTTIRDGTHGISLAAPDKLLGEWTDSGAVSLTVTEDHRIQIYGINNIERYLLTMPGTVVSCEQLSQAEVSLSIII